MILAHQQQQLDSKIFNAFSKLIKSIDFNKLQYIYNGSQLYTTGTQYSMLNFENFI